MQNAFKVLLFTMLWYKKSTSLPKLYELFQVLCKLSLEKADKYINLARSLLVIHYGKAGHKGLSDVIIIKEVRQQKLA